MSEAKDGRFIRHEWQELCADVLEGIYRGRGRAAPTPAGAYDAPGGDLLYDFVKLQALHFNQLARLGIAQADYGRRLLEAWYCAPPGSGRAAASGGEVLLSGPAGSKLDGKFIAINRSDEAVEYTFRETCFCDLNNREEFNHKVEFKRPKLPLAAKASDVVELSVTLDGPKFLKGHTFAARIEILRGTQVVDTRILCIEAQ